MLHYLSYQSEIIWTGILLGIIIFITLITGMLFIVAIKDRYWYKLNMFLDERDKKIIKQLSTK